MSLIIRELHIKVAVNAPSEQGGRTATTPNTAPAAAQGDDDDKEALVAECVEQVMEILRNRLEP